jgi:PAS domain S-box-containing protein
MLKTPPSLTGLGRLVSAVSGDRAALELLSRMLDTLPLGLALYDASDEDFRILYANPASFEFSGYPGRNPVGLRFVEAFRSGEENGTLDVFRQVRRSGEARHFRDVTLSSMSGKQRTWNWDVYPIVGADGSVEQLIGVGQEVTELALARARLAEAADLSLAVLLEVSRHSEAGLSTEDFFSRMGASIAELVKGRVVVFSRYDAHDHKLYYQPHGHAVPREVAGSLGGVPCQPGSEDLVSRIVFGDRVFLGDLKETDAALAPYREALRRLGVSNAAAISWRAGDERLGMLSAYDSLRPGGFQREDLLILRAAGRASGLVWQRRRAELALTTRASQLQELDQLKSRFLRLASHELRAPLAVARGYVSMLTDGSLDASRAAAALPIVEKKLVEMDRMVTQMIDTARLEDSRMSLNSRLVSMREIVKAAAATAAPFCTEAHKFEVRLPDADAVVNGDPARLENIINNLLSNAFKYSPEGGPVVLDLSESDGFVRVAVSDRGLGIPPQDRSRLFTRFGRLDRPGTESIQGTGLGLYLSQELAKEHGGVIEVASDEGRGSTFTLVLPRVPEETSADPD